MCNNPFAGMIQIRFRGYDLSPAAKPDTPCHSESEFSRTDLAVNLARSIAS
jgi:hypothetical protein